MENKNFLVGTSCEELAEYCSKQGVPKFRSAQIANWIYKNLLLDADNMNNIPLALREALKRDFYAPGSRVDLRLDDGNGVCKLRIKLADGETIETVLIPSPGRITFCLSTQVGCPVGCRFCASGAHGLVRNLKKGEILEQFLLACEVAGKRPDNIVFMGIGEGLLNFGELSGALEMLSGADYFAMSPRRITVSTSGFVPGIMKLAELKKEYNLAVSLHAVNDSLRSEIIPDKFRYPVREIVEAADRYRDASGRQYTFEYTLLDGVNDSIADAENLGKLAFEHHAKVNVIPLNQAAGDFRRPPERRIKAFVEAVAATGARVTRRVEKGSGKAAACGQLRSESIENI